MRSPDVAPAGRRHPLSPKIRPASATTTTSLGPCQLFKTLYEFPNRPLAEQITLFLRAISETPFVLFVGPIRVFRCSSHDSKRRHCMSLRTRATAFVACRASQGEDSRSMPPSLGPAIRVRLDECKDHPCPDGVFLTIDLWRSSSPSR